MVLFLFLCIPALHFFNFFVLHYVLLHSCTFPFSFVYAFLQCNLKLQIAMVFVFLNDAILHSFSFFLCLCIPALQFEAIAIAIFCVF